MSHHKVIFKEFEGGHGHIMEWDDTHTVLPEDIYVATTPGGQGVTYRKHKEEEGGTTIYLAVGQV